MENILTDEETKKLLFKKGEMVTEKRKKKLFQEIIEKVKLERAFGDELNMIALNGPYYIKEGLITSYPSKFVLKSIGHLFHLRNKKGETFNKNDEYIGNI